MKRQGTLITEQLQDPQQKVAILLNRTGDSVGQAWKLLPQYQTNSMVVISSDKEVTTISNLAVCPRHQQGNLVVQETTQMACYIRCGAAQLMLSPTEQMA